MLTSLAAVIRSSVLGENSKSSVLPGDPAKSSVLGEPANDSVLPGDLAPTPGDPAPRKTRALLEVHVDIPTPSLNRRHVKWQLRAKATKEQRLAIAAALAEHARPAGEAFTVRFVRYSQASRPLDDDNLVGALKAPRDEVAKFLAIDDGSARLAWQYEQRTRATKRGLRIEVWAHAGTSLPPVYRRRTAHLSPEQVAAIEQRRAERESVRAKRESLLEALAPVVCVGDATVKDWTVIELDERAAGGEILLSMPRRNGAAECIVTARTWDGSDGKPARAYANAHVRWHGKGGRSARTKGIAIEAGELRPVASALLALADRLGV